MIKISGVLYADYASYKRRQLTAIKTDIVVNNSAVPGNPVVIDKPTKKSVSKAKPKITEKTEYGIREFAFILPKKGSNFPCLRFCHIGDNSICNTDLDFYYMIYGEYPGDYLMRTDIIRETKQVNQEMADRDMPISDFPKMPIIPDNYITLNTDVVDAIIAAGEYVSNDKTRQTLQYVCVDKNIVVASTGYILYKKEINTGTELLLHSNVVDAILKLKVRTIDVAVGNNWIAIKTKNILMLQKKCAVKYVNVAQVIPDIKDCFSVKCNILNLKSVMLEAYSAKRTRAMVENIDLTKNSPKQVILEISTNNIKVIATLCKQKGEKITVFEKNIGCEYSGESFATSYDLSQFNIVANTDIMYFCKTNCSTRPLIFVNNNEMRLVMPLKILG